MTIKNCKPCSTCKTIKPLTDYYKNRTTNDGLQHCCIECQRKASRKHYEANRARVYKRTKANRVKQARALIEYKRNKPCMDCGQKFHPYIMEFDHRDPATKDFSIAKRGSRVYRQLREELAKCDLVCANCHKLRTFRRMQQNPEYKLAHLD